MPPWVGSLQRGGCPVLRIVVSRAFGSGREFDAVIDTGFSGFLSMPEREAGLLGLVLSGEVPVTQADGLTSRRQTALGKVTVGDETQEGRVVLEPGSDEVDVGMELLGKFKKALVVCPEPPLVYLVDAAHVPSRSGEQQAEHAGDPPGPFAHAHRCPHCGNQRALA